MSTLFYPTPDVIVALHDRTVEREGGATGLRDVDGLAGAWGRAETARFYGDLDDIAQICLLAHSLIRAHVFVDGNKRAAYAVLSTGLAHRGLALELGADEVRDLIVAAAGGDLDEEDFTARLRAGIRPDPVFEKLFEYDRSPRS
ncbi:hypothetical protein OCH239_09710 [Roseivivax halodurans JCM 10272]|uniref:Fido domain-containing protein n=1 Tax=Roseivivax halodurans JCM 10272 TaxID=1449350 RepID=X7ECF2_9RHOB|nr:type II toxin-antitoxin system death-on-curing family toxin [Roseivivax halodurans]ETX13545.1 hypothetical protein OCH239_09710 [Roseivivax halodurans JCM 10272]